MKGAISQLAFLAATVAALPAAEIQERQVVNAKAAGITDAQILNYALTLEHLEDVFYQQGLKNFTQAQFAAAGYPALFYKNLQEISNDETTHVNFLTTALKAAGATPVAACTYNFGVTSVQSFVATANILEGVGISAYLGAAQNISAPAYLEAAGSILTVEARHSSYIRASTQPAGSLSPFPAPFDTPLDFDEVYSLAAQFISSCPKSNPALPVKAFPVLTFTNGVAPTNGTNMDAKAATGPVAPGSTITLTLKTGTLSGQAQVAFPQITGPVFADAKIVNGGKAVTAVVPQGLLNGQTYALLTTCGITTVTDENILAGPAVFDIVD